MTPRSELLARAHHDLAAFAELAGKPIAAHQADAAELDTRITAWVAGRQRGKTRTLALTALRWAAVHDDARILIVSASESSSRLTLAEVVDTALGSPSSAVDVVDDQAALLILTNGSQIVSVPASPRAIRGRSVDLLLIDEAAFIDDDLTLGAAIPTTAARPHARIVMASSPNGRTGVFFDTVTRGVNGDVDVRTHNWHAHPAPWITAEAERAMRSTLPPARARAELDGEFVDQADGDNLLEPEWIAAAQRRRLPIGRAGVLGVDVARFGGDRTTLYVNRGGHVRRVACSPPRGWAITETTARAFAEARTLRGASLEVTDEQRTVSLFRAEGVSVELKRPVAEVLRAWGWTQEHAVPRTISVIVDDAGLGAGVTDQLRQLGEGAVAFVGANRAQEPERFANRRAEAFWAMRNAFAAGHVDLDPDDADLAQQLRGLKYGYDSKARVLMESKESMRSRNVSSPDHADAVCMTFDSPLWRPVAPVDPIADAERQLSAEARRRRRLEALGGELESGLAPDGSLTAGLLTEPM